MEKDNITEKDEQQPHHVSLSERIRARWSHRSDDGDAAGEHEESSQTRSFTPPPLTPVDLHGYSNSTKSRLLDPSAVEEIRSMLPQRLQLFDQWDLMYSLEQHGASLQTLYANNAPKTKNRRPGYILVVKDEDGHVFGAYVNEHFHPTDSRRFYGNGECFLWRVRVLKDATDIRFEAFPYTGLNDFVIYCTHKFLSLGGGDGHYGLWIDDDLIHGVSNRSLTFGNEILAGHSKFSIVGIEVWRVG